MNSSDRFSIRDPQNNVARVASGLQCGPLFSFSWGEGFFTSARSRIYLGTINWLH
jgi:hypothetical protein